LFEADSMREYDDDIRPYVPVVQRLIILVAVIVAVPAVLWTITTFIRTYVGPPHAPNYQRIAVLQPADRTADSSPVGAPQDITPTAAAAQTANQTQTPSPPAQLTTAPAAADQTATITQAPTQAPSQMALALPPVTMASAPASAAPVSAAPMAWGGSVMMPPPGQTAPDSHAITAAPDRTAAGDDVAALPAVAPIGGHVPLPRRRPNVVAMVQTSALQPTMAINNAAPAGVPLPRARPTAAPEAAAPADTTNDVPAFNLEQAH
jgi:hypothetical protein